MDKHEARLKVLIALGVANALAWGYVLLGGRL
jgi:hypothetical protein